VLHMQIGGQGELMSEQSLAQTLWAALEAWRKDFLLRHPLGHSLPVRLYRGPGV
jgi:hypothetical protein